MMASPRLLDAITGRNVPALRARITAAMVLVSCTTFAQGAQMQSRSFELMEATIPQIQAALTKGTTTSKDLVAAYLARIEAYDQRGPALNAISVVNPNALDEAARLDSERRAGKLRGRLHGVPIIVKDNFETAGMQTANGSASMAGWVPPEDASAVKRLRAAGAIVIAKSNMHEFARGILTVGSLFGATRNPYALDRNPGGSSGGTGAAIAANFAAMGMGSDTCGSIRIPAFHNNLAGIRATQGLISRAGIIPLSSTQDIGGPIARSVTDVAIVLDTLVGYDPADPQTAAAVGNTPKSYTGFLRVNGLRGARIGLLTNLLEPEPADKEVATVVRAAAKEMAGLGAEVIAVKAAGIDEHLADNVVLATDFKFDLNAYLASRPGVPVRSLEEIIASGKYHKSLEKTLHDAQAIASRDTKEYFQRRAGRELLRAAILLAMADHRLDALVYPSIRRKANTIGEAQAGTNCRLSSNSGLPAIVVPAGFTADGLPIGVELLGRAWSEPVLIRLAYAFEQGTRHRRPPASTPALPR